MKITKRLKKILVLITAILCISVFSTGCYIDLSKLPSSSDYTLLNEIYEKDIITSSVSIRTTKPTGHIAEGSGIIFYKETKLSLFKTDETYYVLTNNHVIYGGINNTSSEAYSVIDCYGNKFTANLLARSANYDLAVLSFVPDNNKTYSVLPLANENPNANDTIVSIGAPLGYLNSVTIGKIEGYKTLDIEGESAKESNVTFEVIMHNSPINSGSSGGAVLNGKYEIVGINYACSRNTETGEFTTAYAVPVLKVKEFLENKGFEFLNNNDNE